MAQVGYVQPYAPPAVPPPAVASPAAGLSSSAQPTLQIGGRYYEANLGGLREYVDTLKEKDPALYEKVDPKLSSLETRRTSGWALVVCGVVAGTALALAGLTSHGDGHPNEALLYSGVAVGVFVPVIGFAVMPYQSALLDFVNFHNEQSEARPIVWEGHTAQPLDDVGPSSALESKETSKAPRGNSGVLIAKTDFPTAAGGFSFDASVADTQGACEGAQHEWHEGTNAEFSCSGPAVDIGESAEAALTFCQNSLCVIEFTIHPKSNWSAEVSDLIDSLTEKYGEPNREPSPVPLDCGTQLDTCFDAGRVHKKVWWKFTNGGLITVNAGKDDEQPASLRLRYQVKQPPKPRKDGGSFHDL
jgi:hypothetical protein